MAHITADLIQETSASTNGASLTLAGATTGNRTFASSMANGDTCYAMASNGAGLWQAALYTWTTGGTLTTSAANVIAGSSGAGSIVTFSGTVTISVSPLAETVSNLHMVEGIVAAGTTQGTATPLTAVINSIGTSTLNQGVLLPPALMGKFITVMNHGSAAILIYPAVGESVEALGANVPMPLPVGSTYRTGCPVNGAWAGIDVNPWDDENNSFNIGMHTNTPPTPATDFMRVFGRSVGGRSMLSVMGASGLDTAVQPFIARNKMCFWNPAGNATTITAVGAAALSATGTATAANVATTNVYTWQKKLEYLVTTASATAVAGFRNTVNTYGLGNQAGVGGFHMVCRFAPATGVATANSRCFVGVSTNTAAPTDVQPSTLVNMLGCGYDSADANYQIFYNSASGTATKVDTGIPVGTVDRVESKEIAIFSAPNSQEVSFQFTDNVTGATFYHTTTTNVPLGTVLLSPRGYRSAGGTSSVIGIALMGLYMESDL